MLYNFMFNKSILYSKVINDGLTTWSSFLKHYRRTIKRILVIRGDHKTKFDFNIREVMDFSLKKKVKF